MNNIIALIPCRSGSKRIKDKNICTLMRHPLLVYSIQSALDSCVFDSVVVSTDSVDYAKIADYYGAEVILRPPEFALDHSPDIEWVEYTLNLVKSSVFSILRPTSPFRTGETIRRAYEKFMCYNTDSLRAVELCSQHPEKMWNLKGNYIEPLLEKGLHNLPYQDLPKVYVQNASLEIAWTKVVKDKHSISGDKVIPFFTQGYEGFDINVPYDLKYAEWLIETKQVQLPIIDKVPYGEK
jgi:CMP-N,N'-diacetyllegionaminic acid synthase